MIYKLTHRFIFFALLLITTLVPLSAQERPTPTPPDRPVLTTQQMRNARVISDMRATNRVMVRPNETVVYRLADCDMTDENAPCYVVVSATITPITANSISDSRTQAMTSANRSSVIQCSRFIYNAVGLEVAKLNQNVAVTFHTNNDRVPVTLNWGDYAGSYGGMFARWTSISGPVPNSGWGVYELNQASANTNGFGDYGLYTPFGWVTTYQFSAGVRLIINSSGWGCY